MPPIQSLPQAPIPPDAAARASYDASTADAPPRRGPTDAQEAPSHAARNRRRAVRPGAARWRCLHWPGCSSQRHPGPVGMRRLPATGSAATCSTRAGYDQRRRHAGQRTSTRDPRQLRRSRDPRDAQDSRGRPEGPAPHDPPHRATPGRAPGRLDDLRVGAPRRIPAAIFPHATVRGVGPGGGDGLVG